MGRSFPQQFPNGLSNTKVVFLPANATSICKPLDQGIICAWKAHYRKKWLHYFFSKREKDCSDQDNKRLKAIPLGIEALEEDVTDTTNNNCWDKSRVLNAKYGPQIREEAEKLRLE